MFSCHARLQYAPVQKLLNIPQFIAYYDIDMSKYNKYLYTW